ncbi:ABC transporter permease subunit [Falsiroseomonas selenitidurans]|uniref:ABC transporter permease subunit n=1 Tax=Falsiroseomonas selenitidurans TaxID=2716335 RepID=A0ABX1ECQ8_9PROT|nr:ABC transporter permease subunit [Falsiroseomonas selenitidurans]NKC33548.1 ABC transporter permease subunit [Falsiroseomonas selenitidurans]
MRALAARFAPLLLAAALAAVALVPAGFGGFPAGRLLGLAAGHAGLALAGVVPAALLGLALGVLVTREAGRPLRPAADAFAAGAQAVPPVVAVALAVPAMGFGWGPTILALLLYGIMPVLRATVAALEAVPPEARQAAIALGYTPAGALRAVELPLAWPLVLDGLRVALVLGVATAAVGALAGAATLGTPIVLGLQNQNQLLVLQGAAATAALAFAAEGLLLALAPARR